MFHPRPDGRGSPNPTASLPRPFKRVIREQLLQRDRIVGQRKPFALLQTLGVFFGGLIGGSIAQYYGPSAVFATCAVLSGLWLAAAAGMRGPARVVNDLSSLTFSIASGVNLEGLRDALAAVRGVREAEVLAEHRIARLKVVSGQWDESSVRKLVTGEV